MLQISIDFAPRALTLWLEGRLTRAGVGELEMCWQGALARRQDGVLRLDLSGVTDIDSAGLKCLEAMHGRGAELVAGDSLMKAVVAEIKGSPLPSRLPPRVATATRG